MDQEGPAAGNIADINVIDGESEMTEANAHLIAAAPDLLTELEWTVARLSLLPFSLPEGDQERIAQIKETLSRATGGKP